MFGWPRAIRRRHRFMPAARVFAWWLRRGPRPLVVPDAGDAAFEMRRASFSALRPVRVA